MVMIVMVLIMTIMIMTVLMTFIVILCFYVMKISHRVKPSLIPKLFDNMNIVQSLEGFTDTAQK